MLSKTALCLLLALASSHLCQAQNAATIHFQGDGKLYSEVPTMLQTGSKLNFHVYDPNEKVENYTKQLRDRLQKAKKQLTALSVDNDKLELLKTVYDIDPAEIKAALKEVDAVITSPLTDPATLTYLPNFTIITDYYHALIKNASTIQKTAFNPNSNSSELTTALNALQHEAVIAVTKDDPYKKLIFKWFEATKASAGGTVNWELIKIDQRILMDEVAPHLKYLEQFIKEVDTYIEYRDANRYAAGNIVRRKADLTKLNKLNNAAIAHSGIITNSLTKLMASTDLRSHKNWVLKWLWYQNSTLPALNPFAFILEENLGEEPDLSRITGYQEAIRVREAFLKKIDVKKVGIAQVDTLIRQIDSIKRLSNALEVSQKNYMERKANNEKAKLAFQNTSKELNNLLLLISNTAGPILWMRHHDASTNNSLIGSNIRDEYLENDRVVILAHNLKPGETSTIKISFQDIADDQSQLSESLTAVLGQLGTTLGKVGGIPAFGGPLTDVDKVVKALEDAIRELGLNVMEAKRRIEVLNYLATQHLPRVDLEETIDKSTAFHTQVANPPKKINGPKKASYYLTTSIADAASQTATTGESKAIVDTFTYRVNKLYRIFPMAGLAYTLTNFNEFSTENGSGTKVSSQPRAQLIIGVKVFLRRTDIRNPKFITGKDESGRCLFLSRTNINVAINPAKPLSNIYTGLAFDLWPGFSLNAGAVFNRYDYKRYAGGAVREEKTTYRGGFYVGVSTDVVLFAELLKLLNLSK